MASTNSQTPVVEIIDSEFGRDGELMKRFSVVGSTNTYTVTVRCSPDSGTPQGEKCTCRGFRFRGMCKHIEAIYESGLLSTSWE